jgi:GT2 family glycosyltransferase
MTAENPKPERVCAVIPTYNCKQPLEKCLDVVRRQTRPVDEIIVVDNASTDGTQEMIQERFVPNITYVRLPENLGGSGGYNKGMRLAYEHGHEWIWCLDSDALPSETTLNDMLSAECSSKAPVVAKACALRDPQTGLLYPGGYFESRKRAKDASFPQAAWVGKTVPVDSATLCCLLVRSDAAQRAGFIDPGLFIYLDEFFFSRELKAQGEIALVGTTVVEHRYWAGGRSRIWGQSRFPVEEHWRMYYQYRNRFLYEKRYIGPFRALGKQTYLYLRRLAAILILDDHKLYRSGILTKALWDGLLGRKGIRVQPRDFERRYKRSSAPHQ